MLTRAGFWLAYDHYSESNNFGAYFKHLFAYGQRKKKEEEN
jgi:hypothetical protein